MSGLPEGTYCWRVAPIGGEGSNYSSPKSVRLVKPNPKEPSETAKAKKPVKPVGTASKSNASKSKGVTTPRGVGRPSRTNSETTPKESRAAKSSRPSDQRPRVRVNPARDEAARVTPTPATAVAPKLLPDNGGWRTITGNIAYPVAAHLRS